MLLVLAAGPTATPFLPQLWLKPPQMLITPTHRGMVRLSGPDKYRNARPAKGGDQSQRGGGAKVSVPFIANAYNELYAYGYSLPEKATC